MAIRFQCPCGTQLQAKDEDAGKQVRCPGCKTVLKLTYPAATDGSRTGLPWDRSSGARQSDQPQATSAASPGNPDSQRSRVLPSAPTPVVMQEPPNEPVASSSRPALGKRFLREVGAIPVATISHLVRLLRCGKALWRKRALARSALRAEYEFGKQ